METVLLAVGIPILYLLGMRCTYGIMAWRNWGVGKESYDASAEYNTWVNRMFTSWIWPIALIALLIMGIISFIVWCVTCGWVHNEG